MPLQPVPEETNQVFPGFLQLYLRTQCLYQFSPAKPTFYTWSDILKTMADSKNMRNLLTFLDQTSKFSVKIFFTSPLQPPGAYHTKVHFWKGYRSLSCVSENQTSSAHPNRDSLTILIPKARYYPLTTQWIGSGGHVDWRRAGLDPAQVYADLGMYTDSDHGIRKLPPILSNSIIKIISLLLCLEVISDKAQADVTEEKASYPRFTSYERYIGIQQIFKDVDFFGGFSMEGAKVIGIGSANGMRN